ncbi:MAG TPA: ATP-binding protein [Methanocorpusculum sp.]|nr:ATP-binding protein [Methanocorpusculum sp.]
MFRNISAELSAWKKRSRRKPLILNGIRQVGKTWILKEFGRTEYKNTVYINFENNSEFKEFFETTKNPERILENLSLAIGKPIHKEDTLIIFDEIQECPKALTALKYFCEEAPEYHVAAAGSLLGITLSKPESFPVGKVEFFEVYPLTFSEFLRADKSENLIQYLESVQKLEPLPDAFFNPLTEKLRIYLLTGGMPEAVNAWCETHNIEEVDRELDNILTAYERDFAKHMTPSDYPKASLIWDSVPSQLAKENKKFMYKTVKEGARAREYENALEWLKSAGLIYKIFKSTRPGLPVSAYDEISSFKIYMADTGLLRKKAHLYPQTMLVGNKLFSEFKGALTENYILQSLIQQCESVPRYWAVDNPPYEVDFLVQFENSIIPVEVKSDTNLQSKSLRKYKEKYAADTPLRVRFSLANLKLDDDVLNIPLFMADYFIQLVQIAKT